MDITITLPNGIIKPGEKQISSSINLAYDYLEDNLPNKKLLDLISSYQQPILIHTIASALFQRQPLIIHGLGNTGKSSLARLIGRAVRNPFRSNPSNYLEHDYRVSNDLTIVQDVKNFEEAKHLIQMWADGKRQHALIIVSSTDLFEEIKTDECEWCYYQIHLTKIFDNKSTNEIRRFADETYRCRKILISEDFPHGDD